MKICSDICAHGFPIIIKRLYFSVSSKTDSPEIYTPNPLGGGCSLGGDGKRVWLSGQLLQHV